MLMEDLFLMCISFRYFKLMVRAVDCIKFMVCAVAIPFVLWHGLYYINRVASPQVPDKAHATLSYSHQGLHYKKRGALQCTK